MKLKKITARQAEKITKKLGLCWGDEEKTFYATNEDETEIFEFSSKRERDEATKGE